MKHAAIVLVLTTLLLAALFVAAVAWGTAADAAAHPWDGHRLLDPTHCWTTVTGTRCEYR